MCSPDLHFSPGSAAEASASSNAPEWHNCLSSHTVCVWVCVCLCVWGCLTFALLQQGGDDDLVLDGVEGAGGVDHPASHCQLFHAAHRDTQLQPGVTRRVSTHIHTHTHTQHSLCSPVEVQAVAGGPLLPHVDVLPHGPVSAAATTTEQTLLGEQGSRSRQSGIQTEPADCVDPTWRKLSLGGTWDAEQKPAFGGCWLHGQPPPPPPPPPPPSPPLPPSPSPPLPLTVPWLLSTDDPLQATTQNYRSLVLFSVTEIAILSHGGKKQSRN